jgi:hypothetical protein
MFPVSTQKFILLSIFSLQAYSLYWFYQNWKRLKAASQESLSPFWRTAFAPLWGFSLFSRIRALASEQDVPTNWSPAVLGTLFLLLNLFVAVPDPWVWISLALFLPLVPVQQTAHHINAIYASSVKEARNETYSFSNIATIVVGSLILALLLQTFMPEWGGRPMMTVSR